jgi:hypothetical protein
MPEAFRGRRCGGRIHLLFAAGADRTDGSDGLTGFSSTGSLATARSSFGAAWLDVGRVL